MTETRDLVLADRTFAVPPLPLRHNRVVYPLCRDLSMTQGEDDTESFIGRLVAAGGKRKTGRRGVQAAGEIGATAPCQSWPKLILRIGGRTITSARKGTCLSDGDLPDR